MKLENFEKFKLVRTCVDSFTIRSDELTEVNCLLIMSSKEYFVQSTLKPVAKKIVFEYPSGETLDLPKHLSHLKIRRSDRKKHKLSLKEKVLLGILNNPDDSKLPLTVKKIETKGRAVFSTMPILKDSFICEYTGELLSIKEGLEKEQNLEKKMSKKCFLFFLKNECIDSTRESGRIGRLINHSIKHRNVKPVDVVFNGKTRVGFVATRDIDKNEEILYDYGDNKAKQIEWYRKA